MSAHGFWPEAPRPDEDDARLLLAASVHQLSQVPYPELSRRAGAGPEVDEVMGLSGQPYRRSVLVDRHGRRLAVRVRIDDGTPAGRWHPLAEELVLVDPDGGMDRQHTLAAEDDDHRRSAVPGRRIAVGLLVVLAALVLVFVLVLAVG